MKGDLRSTIIDKSNNRKQELQSKFGDRLVLKQDYGEKVRSVRETTDKHARKSQLDPTSNDKWGHDKFNGPVREREYSEEEEEEEEEVKHTKDNNNLNKVLVRNIPKDISRDQMKEIFNRYGSVKKVQIEDGFAFVSFVDNESALKAHYTTTHKKLLKINGSVVKVTIIEDEQ
mmetsp:Transcript_2743/g.2297  ORF Transcript_2743/g.2297 Transcript_2743/m.2297 type:complete len:173 (+) Transcript_2743:247-765(+)